jgi:hypothetical protein
MPANSSIPYSGDKPKGTLLCDSEGHLGLVEGQSDGSKTIRYLNVPGLNPVMRYLPNESHALNSHSNEITLRLPTSIGGQHDVADIHIGDLIRDKYDNVGFVNAIISRNTSEAEVNVVRLFASTSLQDIFKYPAIQRDFPIDTEICAGDTVDMNWNYNGDAVGTLVSNTDKTVLAVVVEKGNNVEKLLVLYRIQAGKYISVEGNTISSTLNIATAETLGLVKSVNAPELKGFVKVNSYDGSMYVNGWGDWEAKMDALSGAIIYIGVTMRDSDEIMDRDTSQVTETGKGYLEEVVKAYDKTTAANPKLGYCVISEDGVGYVWNGTKWVDIGYCDISTATTASAGLVKFVDDDPANSGKITNHGSGGEMAVVGWNDTLSNIKVESSQHIFS